MKKNLFIVVEGIDGSGKTEIIKLLHNYLFSKSKQYRILTTREPTNGKYGNKIRTLLDKEKDPDASSDYLLDLFIKDRLYHIKKIILPFLRKSNNSETNIVLCDRYYYSNIAFQGTQGIGFKKIIQLNQDFLKPDIAFIMDINPQIALQRIKSRKKEKFEQIAFMEKVRKSFLKLPKLLKENIKIIDASRDIKEVFEDIKKEVDKLLL